MNFHIAAKAYGKDKGKSKLRGQHALVCLDLRKTWTCASGTLRPQRPSRMRQLKVMNFGIKFGVMACPQRACVYERLCVHFCIYMPMSARMSCMLPILITSMRDMEQCIQACTVRPSRSGIMHDTPNVGKHDNIHAYYVCTYLRTTTMYLCFHVIPSP